MPEVAVGEPIGGPLPVRQDVEVLGRVGDARLRQAVTRSRRAREDRVERRDRQLSVASVSEAVGFDVPLDLQFPDVQRVERRAVAARRRPACRRSGRRRRSSGFCLPSMSAGSRPSPIRSERHHVRVEEELHGAGLRVAVDHLVLLERVDADAVLVVEIRSRASSCTYEFVQTPYFG